MAESFVCCSQDVRIFGVVWSSPVPGQIMKVDDHDRVGRTINVVNQPTGSVVRPCHLRPQNCHVAGMSRIQDLRASVLVRAKFQQLPIALAVPRFMLVIGIMKLLLIQPGQQCDPPTMRWLTLRIRSRKRSIASMIRMQSQPDRFQISLTRFQRSLRCCQVPEEPRNSDDHHDNRNGNEVRAFHSALA